MDGVSPSDTRRSPECSGSKSRHLRTGLFDPNLDAELNQIHASFYDLWAFLLLAEPESQGKIVNEHPSIIKKKYQRLVQVQYLFMECSFFLDKPSDLKN